MSKPSCVRGTRFREWPFKNALRRNERIVLLGDPEPLSIPTSRRPLAHFSA